MNAALRLNFELKRVNDVVSINADLGPLSSPPPPQEKEPGGVVREEEGWVLPAGAGAAVEVRQHQPSHQPA